MSDQQDGSRPFDDLFAALCAPFEEGEVKVRQQAGRSLSYITARTAMNRLDEVVGPANWWDAYIPLEHSVVCSLSVRLPDGQIITKADAGGFAGMADPGDDDKSGYSDAFKRAAVKFGVGRYLYKDGVPRFAREGFEGQYGASVAPKNGGGGGGSYPNRSAPPAGRDEPRGRDAVNSHFEGQRASGGNGNSRPQQPSSPQPQGDGSAPKTGRGLFAWIKDRDNENPDRGLLKHVNAWGKRQEFPGRLVDWEGEQVVRGYAEATRKMQSIQKMVKETEAAYAGVANGPSVGAAAATDEEDIPF